MLPGSPMHTQYPFVFPLILAGVIGVKGMSVFWMKMVLSVSVAGTFIAVYFLLRRRIFPWAIVSIIWFALSYKFFHQTDRLLSDPLFMVLLIISLLYFDKWQQESSRKAFAIFVVAGWLAIMTKTAGIALVPACFVAILARGGRKKVFWATITALLLLLPFLGWALRNLSVAEIPTDYVSQFFAADPYDPSKGRLGVATFVSRIFHNIKIHGLEMGHILGANSAAFPHIAKIIAALAAFAVVLTGFIPRLVRKASVIEIFVVVYSLMILAWPFRGYRFLMPIYPFLFAYLISGAYSFTKQSSSMNKRSWFKRCLLALFVLIFLFSTVINAGMSLGYYSRISRNVKSGNYLKLDGLQVMPVRPEYRRLLYASGWLRQNARENELTLTRLPWLVALISETKVFNYPPTPPSYPQRWLDENNIRFILVDEIYPDSLKFVWKLTGGKKNVPGISVKYRKGNTLILANEKIPAQP